MSRRLTNSEPLLQDLTVTQVARVLQRSRSSVVTMILSGLLRAYDAAPDGRQRQWRVTCESLDEFRQANEAKPKEASSRRSLRPRITREYV